MADLAALLVKKNQLIEDIANVTAEKNSAQRALAQAESDLQFVRTADISRKQQEIQAARSTISRANQQLAALNSELAEVNGQIALLQRQQSAAKQSTGETVRQDQIAQAEGANPDKPTPAELKFSNGRVGPAAAAVPTNAEKFTPGTNEDAGTAAPLRKSSQTQQTPQSVAAPGGVRPGTPSTSTTSTADNARPSGSGPQAANSPGAAAAGDDNPGGTGVRARLNNIFGGSLAKIEARPNVLDQYSSYTYNISLYIMSPADYKRLINSKKRSVAGYQLLMRSGGAGPAGTATDISQLSRQERDFVTELDSVKGLGRNQFFPLDYYIDNVQLRSIINGKGTRGAHNATELKFTLVEPNGITFLNNLFAATQQYIAVQGGNVKQNYAAQNFLMVIRFYGYDEYGTLVTANKRGADATGSDVNAIVEKFIPFQFTGIKFRVANKLVEYECSAVCPQNVVATGPARGVIPYNVEITSQTLKELFTGNAKFGSAANSEGRQPVTQADVAAGSRLPPENRGFNSTNESGAGTDFSLGVGA
jgi:hypothetical protein